MHDGDLLEASLPDVLNILSELGTPLRIEWASPSRGGEGAVVQEFEPSLDLASVIELALQVKPEDADMAHVFLHVGVRSQQRTTTDLTRRYVVTLKWCLVMILKRA